LANRWNIPKWLEAEVRERDRFCIYCGLEFEAVLGSGSLASWEHIINDARIVTRENIALCCRSCNASKGQKTLSAWLTTAYCAGKGITPTSIAEVARKILAKENSN
jgi:hypothetical protein